MTRKGYKFTGVFLFLVGLTLSVVYFSSSGCATFGAAASGARLKRMQESPHYAAGKFHNTQPTDVMTKGSRSPFYEFIFGNGEMRVPICTLPLQTNVAKQFEIPSTSGMRITWLGHSTSLIEIDGVTLLTDPMFSERASPISFAGPKRFHPPPLALDEVPHLDVVMISHDHYDHLDMTTVQKLSKRGVTFHVGLGVGAHLEKWGVSSEKIVEHDWWEETQISTNVKLVSVPAQHFSGRSLTNRNSTEWMSWVIIGTKHRVYFSGDTGLHDGLNLIREKLGPFDIAMIEIGQWNAAWASIHLGPDGALEAFQKLQAKKLMPIHWSTFVLGLHSWSQPAEALLTKATQQKIELVTPLLGEAVEPTLENKTGPWWRKYPPTVEKCP